MKSMLQIMKERLSEMDVQLLQEIYEPRVVAVPPQDACNHLCVTPDGEIRFYGVDGKKNPHDEGRRVYIASRDCGLSWKTFLVAEDALGEAAFRPETSQFISHYPQIGRKSYPANYPPYDDQTYIVVNNEGYDAPIKQFIPLTDKKVLVLRQARYFERWKRWILVCEYRYPDTGEQFIQVAHSDDDGLTWHFQELPTHAPKFELTPPHQGMRWQNYSCEPTIVDLSDGTLYMLERTSQDFHYQRFSYDGGLTWTDPEPSIFHGTLTMPVLYRLSDGRIICFWCNNQPLPELDHSKQFPPLGPDEQKGVWEDVFTNRDANHLAISEDDGKHWIGFRELYLNALRNHADFRSIGGADAADKSVHQAEMLELPYGKLLIAFGQNAAVRKIVILDVNWLYEKQRFEDFRLGLEGVTTHMYVQSNSGSYHGFSGHCAWNRTNGALLCPDPDGNFEEALRIGRVHDEHLLYEKQGVVWNFPATEKGEVSVRLRQEGSGLMLCLTDHWYNACDETVSQFAPVCFPIDGLPKNEWHDVTVRFDTTSGNVELLLDGKTVERRTITQKMPYGLCYLHLQTLADREDFAGTIVKRMSMRSQDAADENE